MTETIFWSILKWLIVLIAALVAIIALASLIGLLDFGVQAGQTGTQRAVTKSELIFVLVIAVLTILVTFWSMQK